MQLKIDILHKQGNFILDVDLYINVNATGLSGPSGSGKSTLLRCIAGLERPGAGRIELDNEILFESSLRQWTPPHRRGIGMIFQHPRLFPHLSVQKNLQAGKRHRDRHHAYTEEQIIELMQIGPLLSRAVQHLSGGEMQRVSMARALLAHPRLLLLDEPLTGLDQRLKQRILPFLKRIQSELKIPTLTVGHDLPELLSTNQEIILLNNGRIVSHTAADDLPVSPPKPSTGIQP